MAMLATAGLAIWEQQPDESAQAYEAARLYFSLGADRSQEAVSQKLAKSRQIISRWSIRWSWHDRADAYDRHLAGIEQARREQAVAAEAEKWAERRAAQRENDMALANGLTQMAAQLMQKIGPPDVVALDATKLSPGEWSQIANALVKFVETQSKLARLASDLPTEHQQVDIAPIDWSQVPREITVAFADGRIGLDDVLRHIRRGRST